MGFSWPAKRRVTMLLYPVVRPWTTCNMLMSSTIAAPVGAQMARVRHRNLAFARPTPASQSLDRGFIAVAEAAQNPKNYCL